MDKSFIDSSSTIIFESIFSELNENLNLDLHVDLYFKLKSQLELNTRQLKSEIDEQ